MTTCNDLQTGVMREIMRDVHDLALTYDQAMRAHLDEQTALVGTNPAQRAEERRALHAKVAADLDTFIAALTRLSQAHRDRIII